jgi:hypothetical protein
MQGWMWASMIVCPPQIVAAATKKEFRKRGIESDERIGCRWRVAYDDNAIH